MAETMIENIPLVDKYLVLVDRYIFKSINP